ncbi:MAG: hypothetical protein AABW87_01210 [Nanoarchaeota archaeon]
MFKFLNRRKARRLIEENNLNVDLDSFFIVKKDFSFYIISRDIEKISLNDYNIVHIGLKIL